MLEVIRGQEMGDLKSGFEEVDGVRLGYLVIKGKQMFALSQVFTDLLKNIPRTTVHKRMDHLKVKKHHCDLEELRKLKAINSVAFHAAKCTLISREDVDALYTSCKTERVLKSKRRGAGGRLCLQPALGLHGERGPAEPCSRFWTQSNIWLGLNEAPQSLPIKRRAPDRAGGSLLPPAPHLPRFLCKYGGRLYPEVARPPCKGLLKYAPVGIGSSYVAFHPEPPFFRSKAVTVQSQPKLCRPPGFPRRHRKRPGEDRRGCARGLLLLPPPKPHAHRAPPLDLGRLHVLKQGCCLPDTCSSESESSSFSDHAGHDSDVGSSLSSSSNSASSSSSEEEEESASDSSDANSDEEESSSDSSSASSQASVESIRFRRTSFSSLAGQANLLYHFSGGPGHGRAEGVLGAHCDFKAECPGPAHGGCSPRTGTCFADVGNDRGPRISPPHATLPNVIWRSDLTTKRVTEGDSSPHPKKTVLKQLEHLLEAKQCPQTAFTHCADSKAALSRLLKGDSACTSPPTNGSKIASFKLSPKSHHSQTPPAAEAATANSHPDTPLVHTVKIKVEDISEYEGYAAQSTNRALKHECNVTNEECHSSASEHNTPETASDGKGAPACSERETPSPHTRATSQAAPCALGPSNPEDGEYKFGARIRKNYRKLVLGKRPVLVASPNKPNLKSDRGAHFPAKDEECEETMDDFSVCSKRKRVAINLSAVTKRPFNFMANFPCPPSLIIGSDGELLPAYSLNTTRESHTPHRVHPVWKWQLGCPPLPLPPSHKFRKL